MQMALVPLILIALGFIFAKEILRIEKMREIVQNKPEIVSFEKLEKNIDYKVFDEDPYFGNGMLIKWTSDKGKKLTGRKWLYVIKDNIQEAMNRSEIVLWFIEDTYLNYSFTVDKGKFLEELNFDNIDKVTKQLKKLDLIK